MLDKGRHDRVTFNTASFKTIVLINVIYNGVGELVPQFAVRH